MRMLDIILQKRSQKELTEEELRFVIREFVVGRIPDYQVSALLMAIFFSGMTARETSLLTRCMIDSGSTIDIASRGICERALLVDKHSTGGVGDTVSLILAPLAAALGLRIPMMSGRGLGHSGGTLDKLESIPGYRTKLEPEEFISIIQECGFAMTAQTEKIVPADRLLYALRDASATVESIPLITASILSKKFAEGSSNLVFDVKYGAGAFMKSLETARELAASLVRVGSELGLGVLAVLSDMEDPLGTDIGNFLEVEETLRCLSGESWQIDEQFVDRMRNYNEAENESENEGENHAAFETADEDFARELAQAMTGESADLVELSIFLVLCMLKKAGRIRSLAEGLGPCVDALRSGAALELFWQNVELQGGSPSACKELVGRREGLLSYRYTASASGYVHKLNAYTLGVCAVVLGAGRNVASDEILPRVGIRVHKKRGAYTKEGETLFSLYAEEEEALRSALAYLKDTADAVCIQAEPCERSPRIHSVVYA